MTRHEVRRRIARGTDPRKFRFTARRIRGRAVVEMRAMSGGHVTEAIVLAEGRGAWAAALTQAHQTLAEMR